MKFREWVLMLEFRGSGTGCWMRLLIIPTGEDRTPLMSNWGVRTDKWYCSFARRKHGMGLLGKVMRKKRLTRRMPESSRKRKLGGNSRDHRPYFTYWVTFVQVAILFISLIMYGFGPIGVDLYKRQNMVSLVLLVRRLTIWLLLVFL